MTFIRNGKITKTSILSHEEPLQIIKLLKTKDPLKSPLSKLIDKWDNAQMMNLKVRVLLIDFIKKIKFAITEEMH